MTTFNQFFGTGDKLGEVVLIANSNFPSSFSAGGASFLKDATSIVNPNGLYDEYVNLSDDAANQNNVDGILPVGAYSGMASVIKIGANYLYSNYYTTDYTGTWTLGTGTSSSNMFGSGIVAGVYCTSVSTKIAYSSNAGLTFTETAPLGLTQYLLATNAAETLGVCISANATGTVSGDIYTSTDGINWTARTPSIDCDGGQHIFWSPTLSAFVIVTTKGVYKTTNGYTLTLLTHPTGSSGTYRVTDSGTTIYAQVGTTCYSTVNGVTWTTLGSGMASSTSPTGLFYLPGILYAQSNSPLTRHTVSYDNGVTWTPIYLTVSTDSIHGTNYLIDGVCTIDSLSALITDAGNYLMVSPSTVINAVYADITGTSNIGIAYTRIL